MRIKIGFAQFTLLGFALASFAQTNGPIMITTQPQSQTVPVGANVTFNVTATGTGPLGYQWQFDATNIPSQSLANGIITTVAGNGGSSFSGDGGPATNATLSGPIGVVMDASGNLFIGDTGNGRIRKISTNGIITTVAGGGSGGLGDGGPATNATLNYPAHMAVDTFGNLFIADYNNNRVRQVSASGIITTVAGTGAGSYSGDGGPATNATLHGPIGVALDGLGNLYIADSINGRLRKVSTSGIITTVAGTGTQGYSGDGGAATNASLNDPNDVVLDSSGNLFIADYGNHRVRKVGTDGRISTVAGNGNGGYSGDGGPATNTTLAGPLGVTVDGTGDLFIADFQNQRVFEVNPYGIIRTVAGGGGYSPGNGYTATNASLGSPRGVGLDRNGNLFIGDYSSELVREVLVPPGGPICVVPNVTTNNAGNYTVIVTNASQSVTSSVAVLQVSCAILVNGQLAVGTVQSANPAQVNIVSLYTNGMVFYTLDGTTPTTNSPVYTAPFLLTNSATIQALNLSADSSHRVLSAPVKVQIVPVYNLQTSVVGNGTIGLNPTNGPYLSNSVVVLTPSAAANWAFDHWTGDATGSQNPLSLTMDGPRSVQAVFVQTAFPLTLSTPGGGNAMANGTTNPPATYYPSGSMVTLMANASAGWSFLGWQGDASGTNNPLTVTITQTNNIQAIFGTVVGTQAVGGGSVVLSQTNPIPFGMMITATAVPAAGHFFISWSGAASGTNNPANVTVTSATLTVSALFGTTLAITVQPQSQTVTLGQNVLLSVTAVGNGRLTYQWQLDGTNLPNNTITTVVGGGSGGLGDGGQATNATLNTAFGVAVDGLGNLFVADWNNQRIRKVGANGIITTLAGNGASGYSGDGGPATNATINGPQSVALDKLGNVFIADFNNNVVRKVSVSGIITTVAGIGTSGYSGDGGAATSAKLSGPWGVAVDGFGNLYISDLNNNRIREVNTNGIITTAAGTGAASFSGDGGPATNATMNGPTGLGMDSTNNLFFTDYNNRRVRKVSTNGIITTIAGNGSPGYSGNGGPATNATFTQPTGVAIDASGNVFISDTYNQVTREVIAANGIVQTVAGGNFSNDFYGDGGPATNASFHNPISVAVDGFDNLFIADAYNNRIRKVLLPENPTLAIANLTGSNAGNYTVIVNNSFQSITSSVARLQVAPAILVNGLAPTGTVVAAGSVQVSMVSAFPNGFLFYTLDGTTPTTSSTLYAGPLTLTNSATIQALNLSADFSQSIYGFPVTVQIVPFYPLTVSTPGGGSMTINGQAVSGAVYFPTGTQVTLAATASNGWTFIGWQGAVSATNNPLSLTITQTNNIQAIFATSVGTSSVGGGSVMLNQPNPIPFGATVVASAVPNTGEYFVTWSGATAGTISPVSVTVTNATPTVDALFGALPNGKYTLSVVVNGSGMATLSPQKSYYNLGDSVQTTATPNAGFNFYDWSQGATGTNNPLTVFVTTNMVVQANFVGSGEAPPTINLPPLGQTVAAGTFVTLSVSASGTAPLAYQWSNSTGALPGATNSTLSFTAQTTNADNYFVVVSNAYGTTTSSEADLVVYAPVNISVQPVSQVVPAGANVSLSVTASGYPAPNYLWIFDSTNVVGVNSNVLSLSRVQLADMGTYQVLVTNAYSSQLSDPATLSMSPSITTPFAGATVIWGQDAVLSVGAIGSGALSYQWFDNGVAIFGATNSTFTLSSVQFTNAGQYSVVVASALGSVTNPPAQLVVNPAGVQVGMCASLTLTGTTGYTFTIQYVTDLQSTNWITLTNLTLDQPVELWVDTSTNALTTPHRYYQILPGQ